MDKQTADKKIYEYRDRIFGFAMEKTRNVDKADELASDIICEVYRSFLRADNVANLDGYVYRIARNVWAKYVRRLTENRSFEDIDNVVIPYYDKRGDEDTETIEALRREIGYLSDRQRQIVYMHYYRELSVNEIAKRLDISSGTVKWHLSDARTKLKEGITMTINEQNLELNPVKFTDMGHWGSPGSTGETMDMFDTRLKQNIAFSCYWQPKTLEEIAREIGVPQVFVADDLEKLVDYAYIDKLDNSKNPKYRTNMVITDESKCGNTMLQSPCQKRGTDAAQQSTGGNTNALMDKAADYLCESYFPEVFRKFEDDPDHWGFRCADGDLNFMKYNLVLACIMGFEDIESVDWDEFSVKRPDGGHFIAHATVTDDTAQQPSGEFPYWACGYMNRRTTNGDDVFYAISVDCRYSDRNGGWRDNLTSDWDSLVKFMNSGKDALTPDEYKRLCDKGYVYEDKVQLVIFNAKLDENEQLGGSIMRFLQKKLPMSEEMRAFGHTLDSDCFELMKNAFPEHIRRAAKAMYCTNQISSSQLVPRCVEKLLEKGELKPLTDIQRKSVFSILCMRSK